MSEFVKDKKMVQDLHTVLEYLADEAVDEKDKKSFWTVTEKCAETANRQLATAPDVMNAKLAGCSFTNKADIAFVQKKYRQVFESVVAKARKLPSDTSVTLSGMGSIPVKTSRNFVRT